MYVLWYRLGEIKYAPALPDLGGSQDLALPCSVLLLYCMEARLRDTRFIQSHSRACDMLFVSSRGSSNTVFVLEKTCTAPSLCVTVPVIIP